MRKKQGLKTKHINSYRFYISSKTKWFITKTIKESLPNLASNIKGERSGWMTWQFLNALELFSP